MRRGSVQVARNKRTATVAAGAALGLVLGGFVPAVLSDPARAATDECTISINGDDPYHNTAATLSGSDVMLTWAPGYTSFTLTGTAKMPGQMRTPGAVATVAFGNSGGTFSLGDSGSAYGQVSLNDADASDDWIRNNRPLRIDNFAAFREGAGVRLDGWGVLSNGVPKGFFSIRIGGPGCTTNPTTTTTQPASTTTSSLPPTTQVEPTSNPPLTPTTQVSPETNLPATPVSGTPTFTG